MAFGLGFRGAMKTRTRSPDPEMWSDDLAWFIECGEAALGARSVQGSIVARLERGGAEGSPNADPYSDEQLGFGPVHRGHGLVERYRRLARPWALLDARSRSVHLAYYSTGARLPRGARARLGQLAPVAFAFVAESQVKELADACQKGGQALDVARKRAEARVRKAHRAWIEVRASLWDVA